MTAPPRFNAFARAMHWLMAVLILIMLFIGVGMVSTVSPRYHILLSWHKSIGIIILVLAAARLVNRLLHASPPLPADLPPWQQSLAKGSHVVLYALMFALPLLGWSMLSAGAYPIVVFGSLHLPPILPRNDAVFAALRSAHTVCAFLLFGVYLAHLGAALFHRLIRHDEVLQSML